MGEVDLLRFTAAQGFLNSWVQVTVQQDLPEQAAVLLSVIGGFLALRELQAEVDGSGAERSARSSPAAPDSGVDGRTQLGGEDSDERPWP